MRQSGNVLAAFTIATWFAAAPLVLAQESTTFTTVTSDGAAAEPDGANSCTLGTGADVRTYTAGGGYDLGTISWNGTAHEVNTATWGSELSVQVTAPGGSPVIVTLGSGGDMTPGPHTFTGSSGAFQAINNPAGLWTFRFCETYNDQPGVDAIWDSIAINFNAAAAPPPVFPGNFTGTPNVLPFNTPTAGTTIWNGPPGQPGLTDGAGELANGTRYAGSTFDQVGNEVAYRINWFGGDLTLDLTGLASDLDLLLLDSTGTPAGTLLRSENGGTTAEHVSLAGAAAGTYYAVVDTFGTTNNGSAYNITLTPEPATLCLLVLAGLAMLRRRS